MSFVKTLGEISVEIAMSSKFDTVADLGGKGIDGIRPVVELVFTVRGADGQEITTASATPPEATTLMQQCFEGIEALGYEPREQKGNSSALNFVAPESKKSPSAAEATIASKLGGMGFERSKARQAAAIPVAGIPLRQ